MKKIIAFMLIAFFSVSLFNLSFVEAKAEEKSGITYTKIRYCRDDKNYEGWNIWKWEEGKDGVQINFIGEDEKGKFAVIETDKSTSKFFFIIRKGNWEEKATKDEVVEVNNGDQEIVITQNGDVANRENKKLNKEYKKVNLKLHYFRFNGDYDNFKVSTSSDTKKFDFNKKDDYGVVSEMNLNNDVKSTKIQFAILNGENKVQNNRSIDLAYANSKGQIDAYILEDDERIYYKKDEPIRHPEITSATIDSMNLINFKLDAPVKDANQIRLLKDGSYVDKNSINIKVDDTKMSGSITLDENINFDSFYAIDIPRFKPRKAKLWRVFSSKQFEDKFTYNDKLGAIYSKDKTNFVLWAPTANKVQLALYNKNNVNATDEKRIVDMQKGEKGTWKKSIPGNLDGQYYNYLITENGEIREAVDPYAKAVGVNGKRSMVVDLSSTNPKDWNKDKRPELAKPTDAIIYEMHIRDFSIDENSGIDLEYKGKYKGVWQKNTVIPGSDIKTGISHLKELGVNTVQIMPTYDYNSVDESKTDSKQYNWGYDPQNYNVPEGSYSSNPYDGKIRIKEFKELINGLHKEGIKVVMDVVYNHTDLTENSVLNLAVPGYYYRQNKDGGYSNASGCGNETASERSMVRKYILDSVKYWVEEYHIDGLRFDLMGIHDIETMKLVRKELDKIDSKLLLYGEGWTGGESALDDEVRALKVNESKFGEMQLGMFSDDLRDGLRGCVFTADEAAFINGKAGSEESVKFGIVGATNHDDVDYSKINYSKEAWANEPYQCINYASCHDNLTLFDRINTVDKNLSKEEAVKINKISAAVVLTSQGIPFMQAGEEFARTKVDEQGNIIDNSYDSGDYVNKLDWNRVGEYSDLYNYYRGLIQLRKNHEMFRMNSNKEIRENIKFMKKGENFKEDNVIGYTINGKNLNDKWGKVAVLFNSNNKAVDVTLPESDWIIVVNGDKAGCEMISELNGKTLTLEPRSSYVLVSKKSYK